MRYPNALYFKHYKHFLKNVIKFLTFSTFYYQNSMNCEPNPILLLFHSNVNPQIYLYLPLHLSNSNLNKFPLNPYSVLSTSLNSNILHLLSNSNSYPINLNRTFYNNVLKSLNEYPKYHISPFLKSLKKDNSYPSSPLNSQIHPS
jgi:hypothetical protein